MLATMDQVRAIAGLSPGGTDGTDTTVARLWVLLDLASGLVSDEMGYTADPDPIPTDVTLVTVGMIARAIANPNGVVQDTAGPFTVRYADTAEPGLYLTEAERHRLTRLRTTAPALSGLWTLSTTRGTEIPGVPVEEYDPFSEGWPV